MKAVLYTLALAITVISCATVEKMVNRGEYEAAFDYAIKKIKQGRKLKSNEVKGLEKAFEILDTKAVDEIESLSDLSNAEVLQRKINVYQNLDNRHKKVKYLLPITSKDGYTGQFLIKNFDTEITNTKTKYCDVVASQAQEMLKQAIKTKNKNLALEAHDYSNKIIKYNNIYEGLAQFKSNAIDTYCDIVFDEAKDLLSSAQKARNKELANKAITHASLIDKYQSNYPGLVDFKSSAKDSYCDIVSAEVKDMLNSADRSNNKELAKRAFSHISLIEKYNAAYPGLHEMKNEAIKIGHTLIAVKIDSDLNGYIGHKVEQYFHNLPLSTYDNLWYDYTMEPVKNADLDMIIALDNIDLGREYERVNEYWENKDVCVRIEKVKQKCDSVEVVVDKEIFELVSVRVIEVWRERKSMLNGNLLVYDNHSKEYISRIPINTHYEFNGYGCRYEGDKRALSSTSECKLDAFLESYPDDHFLVDNLTRSFRDVVLSKAGNIKN